VGTGAPVTVQNILCVLQDGVWWQPESPLYKSVITVKLPVRVSC
jgi:hypothetical protein